MAEEDFEIDVYGDAEGGQDQQDQGQDQAAEEYNHNDQEEHHAQHPEENHEMEGGDQNGSAEYDEYAMDGQTDDQQVTAPDPPQGVKRKQEDDERPVDQLATNAVLLSDMQWWDNEDDIRGWARAGNCEEELKDITFSEHKVNGKSKGQAYVEFTSPQASTAFKRYIESLQSGEGTSQQRRPSVSFHVTTTNPFKTLPKDAPQRQGRDSQGRGGTPAGQNFHNASGPVNNFQNGNPSTGYQGNNYRGRGGYRGGMRGGYNQVYGGGGGGGNNMGTFNNNNNNGMNGFNPVGGVGFNRGGFGGGFNNRGGPGMRGRGGMGMMNGPMMPNPMGMGGMMPNMGMMGSGMGMGFNNMPGQFNPGFFGGNQGGAGGGNFGNNQGSGDWSNPHGVKRARGE
ncbi:hypothetical protein N0V93_009786 [Gnomoniopsis smithogilvyi]|uniref:RRM domain-containing protein n=1 Tax=Gnomoniopsis smithogilvyi TaxID=1191159 RepID=A0A9W8YNT1_9PEZI|nr:hypothetical protein N0V93_009786 [Gnomoniopsis smithogilvyi]